MKGTAKIYDIECKRVPSSAAYPYLIEVSK